MFQLNAPLVIRAKVKEVRTNIVIYSHALLRIHVTGGQRSVRIASPTLPPHRTGPATRDFQSSISVEVLLCGYHLDVQGLLQQLLSSAKVQYGGLFPLARILKQNSYPVNFIRNASAPPTQETADASSQNEGQEEEKGPLVVIPYVAGMSEDIRCVCRNFSSL